MIRPYTLATLRALGAITEAEYQRLMQGIEVSEMGTILRPHCL